MCVFLVLLLLLFAAKICILAGVEFRITTRGGYKKMCRQSNREEIAINYMHRIFMAQLISKILVITYTIKLMSISEWHDDVL